MGETLVTRQRRRGAPGDVGTYLYVVHVAVTGSRGWREASRWLLRSLPPGATVCRLPGSGLWAFATGGAGEVRILRALTERGTGPDGVPVRVEAWSSPVPAGEGAAGRGGAGWVGALLDLLEARDGHTGSHCRRVAGLAPAFAAHLGLSPTEVARIALAGLVHDIGKLAVPAALLTKTGPLSPDEFAQVRLHPLWGAQLARDLGLPGPVVAAVLTHHERWDGGGYPLGLAGDEVPLAARVIALADAFDAMTSCRPYAGARPVALAVAEVEREAGRQFDPVLAGRFAAWVREGADGLVDRWSGAPAGAEVCWAVALEGAARQGWPLAAGGGGG